MGKFVVFCNSVKSSGQRDFYEFAIKGFVYVESQVKMRILDLMGLNINFRQRILTINYGKSDLVFSRSRIGITHTLLVTFHSEFIASYYIEDSLDPKNLTNVDFKTTLLVSNF